MSSVGLRTNGTTLQSVLFGDMDCGCHGGGACSSFVFPTEKGSTPSVLPVLGLCVCGYWFLPPSHGHLASARSG